MADVLTLGVDVGGTKTRVAVVDSHGQVLLVDETPTAADGGADPGLQRSHALTIDVLDRARGAGWDIHAVGVGMPEYVDASGLLRSRDVIAWDRQPLELFADLGPVVVESDVRCGAIAESALGAGQGASSMLYASIGTGISCCLVVGGRPLRGHRGEAIALGELPVVRHLAAPADMTLERFASGAGMAQRLSALTGQQVTEAREVLARADAGDAHAGDVVRESATALGAALAWAVHLLDPACVVLGGGLGSSGGPWADGVTEAYVRLSRPEPPPLRAAALGAESGAIGAGLVAGTAIA